MIPDIDAFARKLPSMTMHGPIPPATTHQLAARVVKLADRVAALEKEHSAAIEAVIAKNAEISWQVSQVVVNSMREAVGCGPGKDPIVEAKAMRDRMAELETRLRPRPMNEAPLDGSPVIVETRDGQPLLVHWVSHGGDGHWVSQGAALTNISLTGLYLPITPWGSKEGGA